MRELRRADNGGRAGGSCARKNGRKETRLGAHMAVAEKGKKKGGGARLAT